MGTKRDLAEWRRVTPEEGQALATAVGALGWREVSSLHDTGGTSQSLRGPGVVALARCSFDYPRSCVCAVTEAFTALAHAHLPAKNTPAAARRVDGCVMPSHAALYRVYQSSLQRRNQAEQLLI